MKRAVIYARVSSEEQEREGFSIPSQLKSLRELAERHKYVVLYEFIESASAWKDRRKIFADMVTFIRENKVDALLVYKIDRLTRNHTDLATIKSLIKQHGLALVFVEGTYDNSPMGELMLDIGTSFASYYCNNLSADVARGMLEKARSGVYPKRAPIGYKNDRNTRTIVVDEERSFYIRKAFELYATGKYSIQGLREELYSMGFRTRRGNKIYNSGIEYILRDPIYYGAMRYKGEILPGKHTPIISKELFDRVQQMMNVKSKNKKTTKHKFALRGFLVCGECGCSLTAEHQKTYTYYRCSKSKGKCSQKYSREELLAEQIEEVLSGIEIDERLLGIFAKAARVMRQEESEQRKEIVKGIEDALAKVKIKESRLLDSFLEGYISPDAYKEKAATLEKEKQTLQKKLLSIPTDNDNTFELMDRVVMTAKTARKAFVDGGIEEKKNILGIVASNFVIENRKIVSYQLKEPFERISKWPKSADFQTMWALQDLNL